MERERKRPLLKFSISADGITERVMNREICRCLGNEATYTVEDEDGKLNYIVSAWRSFTQDELKDLKLKSRNPRTSSTPSRNSTPLGQYTQPRQSQPVPSRSISSDQYSQTPQLQLANAQLMQPRSYTQTQPIQSNQAQPMMPSQSSQTQQTQQTQPSQAQLLMGDPYLQTPQIQQAQVGSGSPSGPIESEDEDFEDFRRDILIKDKNRRWRYATALMDTQCNGNWISASVVSRLHLGSMAERLSRPESRRAAGGIVTTTRRIAPTWRMEGGASTHDTYWFFVFEETRESPKIDVLIGVELLGRLGWIQADNNKIMAPLLSHTRERLPERTQRAALEEDRRQRGERLEPEEQSQNLYSNSPPPNTQYGQSNQQQANPSVMPAAQYSYALPSQTPSTQPFNNNYNQPSPQESGYNLSYSTQQQVQTGRPAYSLAVPQASVPRTINNLPSTMLVSGQSQVPENANDSNGSCNRDDGGDNDDDDDDDDDDGEGVYLERNTVPNGIALTASAGSAPGERRHEPRPKNRTKGKKNRKRGWFG